MIWYLAICIDCTPILPQPFADQEARAEWVKAHETTGHRIVTREDSR